MECIAVLGAGIMGRGIVQVSAAAGFRVKVFDIDARRAHEAVGFVAAMLRRAAEKGQLSADDAEKAEARMQVCDELQQIRGADLVIEAAAEDMEVKQRLFVQVESIVGDDVILASNTSSLVITQIASACCKPERVAGLHFFNPVPLMKLVEIIPSQLTDGTVVEKLAGYVSRVGHASVVARDTPGFLVNHAGRAFYTEGVRIVSEGIASVVDVDRVARDVLGFRMGPFELFDHTGLDVSYPVLTTIYHQYFEEPRFRPHPLLARQHAAGLYGKKTGRGFYEYRDGARVDPPEEAFTGGAERAVWIADRGPNGLRVRETLGGLGITLDDSAAPRTDSLIIVLPRGADSTTTAVREGLALECTLAIDSLIWPPRRFTLMPTVNTATEAIDSLRGMLGRRGQAVTRIHDSPGFIAQRMLASIVNLACDIAQQRVGTPADIDRAVRLGLNYPQGPVAWGAEVGARQVLEILENLQKFYGDMRYRPSPWLKRRALAGVALTTPDA